jgi:hypothetical protein
MVCFGRFGDNCFTEDEKIGFPPLGDRGFTKFNVRIHYSVAQLVDSQNEGNNANRAHRHRISVAEYEVLSSFTFIGICLRGL